MRLISWSLIWIIVTLVVTGSISYISADLDLTVWQTNLQMSGGVFFMIALIVGGVLTTDSAFRNRKRAIYREEWSFICILVTISLFGISILFS